jgi:hypothetical protein
MGFPVRVDVVFLVLDARILVLAERLMLFF